MELMSLRCENRKGGAGTRASPAPACLLSTKHRSMTWGMWGSLSGQISVPHTPKSLLLSDSGKRRSLTTKQHSLAEEWRRQGSEDPGHPGSHLQYVSPPTTLVSLPPSQRKMMREGSIRYGTDTEEYSLFKQIYWELKIPTNGILFAS